MCIFASIYCFNNSPYVAVYTHHLKTEGIISSQKTGNWSPDPQSS